MKNFPQVGVERNFPKNSSQVDLRARNGMLSFIGLFLIIAHSGHSDLIYSA